MKQSSKFVVILSCLLTIHLVDSLAQKVTVNDVTYKLEERGNASYDAYVYSIPKKSKEITIAGKVDYKGVKIIVKGAYSGIVKGIVSSYKGNVFRPENSPYLETVILDDQFSEVPENLFKGANQIKKVVLPNTIREIGQCAFLDCTSLESINFPSSLKAIGKSAFFNCKSLKEIKGIRPDINFSSNCFDKSGFNLSKYSHSYEYFLYFYIYDNIKKWQQKGEFETLIQYQQRVNKESQDEKIKELQKYAVNEFTKIHKFFAKVSNYDADNQIFKIITSYGDKYVKVPLDEAPGFKASFDEAGLIPSFSKSGFDLILSDLAIYINGKEYRIEQGAATINSQNNVDIPSIELPTLSYKAPQNQSTNNKSIDNSIDRNIPVCGNVNDSTFAVIIGNEKYQRVISVPYANNDAKVFADYCQKTLGIPEKNIRLYENATYGSMIAAVNDIQKIAQVYKGNINVLFYYAGHGIPDESTGDSYLLPIDADGVNMKVCYPLNQLYKELGGLNAKNVICFMDCCFSGADRGDGMIIAARGVAIKAKSNNPTGKTIVFTAATDKQTAFPYKEKGHGMFTYHLLKKIRDTKGECTLGELGTFLCDEVAKQSIVVNGKDQTPIILTSSGITEKWKSMKLK